MSARSWGLAVALLGTAALAQERPSEEDLFGQGQPDESKPDEGEDRPSEGDLFGGEPGQGQDAVQAQPPAVDSSGTDDERLSGTSTNAFDSGEQLDNPLTIGGLFYLQSQAAFVENQPPREGRISAPTLIDAYLDARPSDRLRAMVVGRLAYDPTQPPNASTSGFAAGETQGNPAVLLDQAWLRFDIARTVFVTAGKQHVKWGTGFIWNPTDFLSPTRRNPLLFFDPRVGTSMVKLHVPWEATGWNFYAIGLLDNTQPADRLGKLGAAGRAELVFGQAELGLDAVVVNGRKPRFGVDFSAAVGPLDVYGEAALRRDADGEIVDFDPTNPRFRSTISHEQLMDPSAFVPAVVDALPRMQVDGFAVATTLGATWTIPYAENETVTVGAEYFYNSLGYDNANRYGGALFAASQGVGTFNPLYIGKHYIAAYALLAGPGSWDRTSFTLFNLASITDGSATSRLNFSIRVLNHLSLEAFAAVNYGNKGGVFRLGMDLDPNGYIPAGTFPEGTDPLPRISFPAPVGQLGIGARISI